MKKPHLRYKDQTRRERTWTIHFISVMKFVKAAVLVAIGVKLLTLVNRDVHEWATDFVSRHGIDAANRFVDATLDKLTGFGNKQIATFSTVAFTYSGLLMTEGIGLWLQKRWAEYLTAFATALLIPIELYELYERFTWVRIAILGLNVFIVWYLVTRLKDEKKDYAAEATENIDASGTRVKICGITDLSDGLNALECGADAIGFNFYKGSKRYISPSDAEAIGEKLPLTAEKIGVFVNADCEKIVEIQKIVQLDAIQLHGDESPEFIAKLRALSDAAIIKAFRIGSDFDPNDVLEFKADAILLDAYSESERGGTGKTIDLAIARRIVEIADRVYLAGGLTAENVSDAIRAVQPFAVDVASGVESAPGKKDHKKVAAFINAAKDAL
ncbi:MAG TPA: phosphoribosylanthranilate isomerase [Pyrinomonadaceae bacterium]|nr:phosphoribosylanthranilate isomerase [Pyrinomonadaceae bacterium]